MADIFQQKAIPLCSLCVLCVLCGEFQFVVLVAVEFDFEAIALGRSVRLFASGPKLNHINGERQLRACTKSQAKLIPIAHIESTARRLVRDIAGAAEIFRQHQQSAVQHAGDPIPVEQRDVDLTAGRHADAVKAVFIPLLAVAIDGTPVSGRSISDFEAVDRFICRIGN